MIGDFYQYPSLPAYFQCTISIDAFIVRLHFFHMPQVTWQDSTLIIYCKWCKCCIIYDLNNLILMNYESHAWQNFLFWSAPLHCCSPAVSIPLIFFFPSTSWNISIYSSTVFIRNTITAVCDCVLFLNTYLFHIFVVKQRARQISGLTEAAGEKPLPVDHTRRFSLQLAKSCRRTDGPLIQ